ncbi:hypothetical protein ACRRTK_001546 [Alexandromys fortis]
MLEVFLLPTRSTGQPSYCLLRKAHLEPKETLPRSPDLSLLSHGSWCHVSCEQSACCYHNCEDSATETTHLELTLWRGGGGGWGGRRQGWGVGRRITPKLQRGTTADYSLPPRNQHTQRSA